MEEEFKRQEADERHQKLVNEFRKLGEEYAALQVCFVFCRVNDMSIFRNLHFLFQDTRDGKSRGQVCSGGKT